MMLFLIRFQGHPELSYSDPSQFQKAIEEAYLADQGFVEKLMEDIKKAASNTGGSNYMLNSFKKFHGSNQNAVGRILKQVSLPHGIFLSF